MTDQHSPSQALILRKQALKLQLQEVEQNIQKDYLCLTTSSQPSGNMMEGIIQNASRAWFIIDGAITGYKLIKRFERFSGFFPKFRK